VSKTLADIEAIVRARGDFRNSQRFPPAYVQTEIQAAFGEFYELIADANEGYYDTTGTVTTTASVDFVALPVGAWRVRGVDRLDGGDWVPLVQVGIADRTRYGTQLEQPSGYRLTSRGADLYPTPDAVYTLRFIYTPIAPTLDATAREFYNGWEEYTVYGALVRLALNERRDASDWQQQLGFQRERIQRASAGRRSQGPETLPLREGWGGIDDIGIGRWRW
jgi:hypothetical protein